MSYFNEYVFLSLIMGVMMLYLMFIWLGSSDVKAANKNSDSDAQHASGGADGRTWYG